MLGFMIFGWDGDHIDLGDVDPEELGIRDLDGPCRFLCDYSYFHLFFIFGFVTSRTYTLVNRYDEAVEIDSDDAEEWLEEVPIPFMHRWGLAIFIGAIVLLGALGGVLRR